MLREYERAKVSKIQGNSEHNEYSYLGSGFRSHRKGNQSSQLDFT